MFVFTCLYKKMYDAYNVFIDNYRYIHNIPRHRYFASCSDTLLNGNPEAEGKNSLQYS